MTRCFRERGAQEKHEFEKETKEKQKFTGVGRRLGVTMDSDKPEPVKPILKPPPEKEVGLLMEQLF